MQANPTLASGDVKVAIDDGAPANLATLPVVDADFTKRVKVDLSAAEMNGDRITVIFSDASGAEWCDLTVDIATVTNQFDALATQTSVNTIDDFLDTEIADIQSRLPAALVSGRIDASVGAAAANVITATAIANDAITDAKVASDVTIASVTGAVGSVTGNVGGDVVGSVASVTAGVTVTTNNDKTGYGLSAAAVQAIWDALTSALTTVGSIGKLLVDNINATISSRLATAGYTAPPTAAANADAVWDETLADHLTAGSTGNALNAAGAAGDPWTTALPGAYVAGSAGNIIGNNLNATVGSRATQTSVDDLPTNAELATSQASADDVTLAAIAALNNLSAAQVNAEVDTALADYDAPTRAELTSDIASLATFIDTEVAAILVDTNELQTDWANGGRLDLLIDTLITNVAAILADTGTDGIVISAATRQAIADEVLSRGVDNVEDTANTTSLAAIILAILESSAVGTSWTIRKTDGTTFVTKTLTTDADAEPVIGVT